MIDTINNIRVIKSLSEIANDDKNTVAAVGNFDGVHLGHRKIIEHAKTIADRVGARTSVLTFEPPKSVISDRRCSIPTIYKCFKSTSAFRNGYRLNS